MKLFKIESLDIEWDAIKSVEFTSIGYTVEESKFLKYYYKATKISLLDSLDYSQYVLKNTQHFTDEEKIILLMINKIYFDSLKSFFDLTEAGLPNPSFTCLRSALEAQRLLSLLMSDDEFRKDYIHNENSNFREKMDRSFTQGSISKKMEKNYNAMINTGKITLGFPFSNKNYIQGSTFSGIYSELSKWSHMTNINLLSSLYLDSDDKGIGIYLGFGAELSSSRYQIYIKKYTECIFTQLIKYNESLSYYSNENSLDFKRKISSFDLLKILQEYIDLFYKE